MWDKLKRRLWEWREVLITAPSVTVLLVALRLLGWLQPLDLAAIEQFFLLRFREISDARFLIVGVNERDIQKLK